MERLPRLRRRHSTKGPLQGPTKFVGTERVPAQNPFAAPKTRENRRRLNPTFASTDKQARNDAAERKRAFEAAYREALEAWRAGDRNVECPTGTWAMVRYHGCRAAAQV